MAEALKLRYSRTYLQTLADVVASIHAPFPKDAFLADIFDAGWDARELKERMRHIAQMLKKHLPPDYADALAILKQAAPHFGDFEAMFFPDFVEIHGTRHKEIALDALLWFTRFSSSELAVRPFILEDPKDMARRMAEWAKHESYHVRRLASEGCRPRLPWAMALPVFKKDPTPILPILESLMGDSQEYVRRSVANNLNDIAKDHPETIIDLLRQKLPGANRDTQRLLKHAARTLLKQGEPRVMALFGFADPAQVQIHNLRLTSPEPTIGQRMAFACDLHLSGEKPQLLRLEYAVAYLKANGSHSSKVFKISEKEVAPGTLAITREHSFQERTTRKHYPGLHHIDMIINGIPKARLSFNLHPAP